MNKKNIKKNKKKLFLMIALCCLIFLLAGKTQAQEYKIMEAIPGFFQAGSVLGLAELISAIYKMAIWIVGIAALFMITIGGFLYATSAGNTATAGNGKRFIKDALLGLVVALGAYFILNFFNPDLVNTNNITTDSLTKTSGQISSVEVSAETATLIENLELDDLAQEILDSSNIKLQGADRADCANSSGERVSPQKNMQELAGSTPMTVCNAACETGGVPCGAYQTASKKMLEALVILGQSKSFEVTSFSGGQHGSNSSTHYKGQAVDIVPPTSANWNTYVEALVSLGANPDQTFCEDPKATGGSIKSLDCKVKHHIHASFLNS